MRVFLGACLHDGERHSISMLFVFQFYFSAFVERMIFVHLH